MNFVPQASKSPLRAENWKLCRPHFRHGINHGTEP